VTQIEVIRPEVRSRDATLDTPVGANGYADLFDQRLAIFSHLVVHHDDPQVIRGLASKPRRRVGIGDDDVRSESPHHAQRLFDSAARGHRKSELGENRLGLRDNGIAFAHEEDEWRKTARVRAASSAARQSTAVGYTSVLRCLWHGCR
jgi:hypothetical protein